jgi:xylose isomerase
MFGAGRSRSPVGRWHELVKMAETRVRVAFEFLEKLGAPFTHFMIAMLRLKGEPA